MIAGSALESFFSAQDEEKSGRAMTRFKQILAEWEELGARVVASMCDDLFQVGPTESPRWAWYLLFDVDDLDVAAAMIQATREEVDGVRGDAYFRFELRIGRPFYAREE
jgi:uridine phosphorylase